MTPVSELTQADMADAAEAELRLAFPEHAAAIFKSWACGISFAGVDFPIGEEMASIVLGWSHAAPVGREWSCTVGIGVVEHDVGVCPVTGIMQRVTNRPRHVTQAPNPRSALASGIGGWGAGLIADWAHLPAGTSSAFAAAISALHDADAHDAFLGIPPTATLREQQFQHNLKRKREAPMPDAMAEVFARRILAEDWQWAEPGMLVRSGDGSVRLVERVKQPRGVAWMTHPAGHIRNIDDWWPDVRDAATFGALFAGWQAKRRSHIYRQPCPVLGWSAGYGLACENAIQAFARIAEEDAKVNRRRASRARRPPDTKEPTK